jgi:hypothetical protein
MADAVPTAATETWIAAGERLPTRIALVVALALAGLAWRLAIYLLTGHPGGPAGFVEAHCVWDCGWYAGIVDHGYQLQVGSPDQPETANWAFFPLYPMLAAVLVYGFGASYALAGLLLSNLLTIAMAVLARPLLGTPRAYWFFVATLMIGPFSVLFSSFYTESLFALLTVLTLRALRQSNYLQAAAWTALISATRISGVLMVFAIAAQVIIDHRRDGGRWRDLPMRVLGDRDLLLAIFLAPLGLFAYMAFLWFWTGDALAFSHIQRGWDREMEGPIAVIGGLIAAARDGYTPLMEWTWLAFSVGALVLAYVLRLRHRVPEAIFCALALFASLSTSLASMTRYAAGLVPLGMVTAELLTSRRWLTWTALAAAIVLDAVISLSWYDKSMFLM